jgi:hypothetical protein
MYKCVLLQDRLDSHDPDSLGQGHELEHHWDLISSSISLERECERVHDFARPCVFDFQSLIEFESFIHVGSVKSEGPGGVEVRGEAGSDDVGS